jgi:hypothetical protein
MQMLMQMQAPRTPAVDPALASTLQAMMQELRAIGARVAAIESDDGGGSPVGQGGVATGPFQPGTSVADAGKSVLLNAAAAAAPKVLESLAPMVVEALQKWREKAARDAEVQASILESNRQMLQVLNGTHGRGAPPPPAEPQAPQITVESAERAYAPPTMNGAMTPNAPASPSVVDVAPAG